MFQLYFAPLTREACTKIIRQMFYWGSKCELLKASYNDWQHIETFVAGKLMQFVIFIIVLMQF